MSGPFAQAVRRVFAGTTCQRQSTPQSSYQNLNYPSQTQRSSCFERSRGAQGSRYNPSGSNTPYRGACLPSVSSGSSGSVVARPGSSIDREIKSFDPSVPIKQRSALSTAEIAKKLEVKSPSSNEDLDIKNVGGKTVISITSKDARFDIGYTTHDNASSKMQLNGDANRYPSKGGGHKIDGRYEIKVEKLSDGSFSYTLTLDENLSGAALRIGNKDYVISTSEKQEYVPKEGTIGAFLRDNPEDVRSPSDIIPEGLSLRQYLGSEEISRETLDLPFEPK